MNLLWNTLSVSTDGLNALLVNNSNDITLNWYELYLKQNDLLLNDNMQNAKHQ